MPEIKPKDMMPEPTLGRLPWYLAYVSMLRTKGVEHVSSTQISKEIDVDASRIAKDLSFINIKGKTRIGYDVAELERVLVDFLGFQRVHNAIIAGVGSLGAALIRDSGLSRYGLNIVAGFDISEHVVGSSICGVPVYDISQIKAIRAAVNAEIGIIAVPVDRAQTVADTMVDAGVKALWNFTPFRIRTPREVVLQDTSIYAHLAVMYNRIQTHNATPYTR
ncbi:MAG: redox-sensing transcriptional repressor Rex [Muribaculaceae bacterium]